MSFEELIAVEIKTALHDQVSIHSECSELLKWKAVMPEVKVTKIFHFVCILEIKTTEEVTSKATFVSKQLSICEDNFKLSINKPRRN